MNQNKKIQKQNKKEQIRDKNIKQISRVQMKSCGECVGKIKPFKTV
jgi:hypothetical protein